MVEAAGISLIGFGNFFNDVNNLSTYDNGLTRCTLEKWEEQIECGFPNSKSKFRKCCFWMREDGTCGNPDVCHDNLIKLETERIK